MVVHAVARVSRARRGSAEDTTEEDANEKMANIRRGAS